VVEIFLTRIIDRGRYPEAAARVCHENVTKCCEISSWKRYRSSRLETREYFISR